jgi:hypothetical protein
MPNSLKLIIIALIGVISGCAHGIQLTPNLDDLHNTDVEVENKINKNVAYYISQQDMETEVITPGGGGDKVKYYPYRDTEAALDTMLSKVFNHVYSIPLIKQAAFIQEKNISYIFKPSIKTDSSSDSIFTWPPTHFTFELTCTATDPSGNEVWSKKVKAEGNAEYDEFKKNFSLSARRASEEAFKLMLAELLNANYFKEN